MINSLGVLFGEMHSYKDFGLILKKKTLDPPPPNKYQVKIEGTNGRVDLSTVNTDGEPTFDNRTLGFEFDLLCPVYERSAVYDRVTNYLHGMTMNVIVDEDSEFYYVGCISVDSTEDTAINHSRIIISVDAEPYKYSLKTSIDDWLWDPFSFKTGVIYKSYTNVTLNGTRKFIIPILRMPVVPTFITTAPLTVKYRDVAYEIPEGTSVVPNIVLTRKYNELEITAQSTAVLTIEIRNGAL